MNPYARAIEILMDHGTDHRELLVKVAQLNPSAIVRAYEGVDPHWMKDVDDLIRNRERIKAIKLWREMAGVGLREAKEAVDKRQEDMGL